MSRRLPATGLLVLVAALAGCGGSPAGPGKARADFITAHRDLKDWELATACPSLYPSDFLEDPGKYRYTKPTRQERADAARRIAAARTAGRAAGCTNRGTKPE